VDLSIEAVPEGAPTPAANRARFDAHQARVQRRADERAALLMARKQLARTPDPHTP
jgi:hypothetical protein